MEVFKEIPYCSSAVISTSYGKKRHYLDFFIFLAITSYHSNFKLAVSHGAATWETKAWPLILPQILNVILATQFDIVQIHKVNYAFKFQLITVRNRLLNISLYLRLLHPNLGSPAQVRHEPVRSQCRVWPLRWSQG